MTIKSFSPISMNNNLNVFEFITNLNVLTYFNKARGLPFHKLRN